MMRPGRVPCRVLFNQRALVRYSSHRALLRPMEKSTLSIDALNCLRFFLPCDNFYRHQRQPGDLGMDAHPRNIIATCRARVQGFLAACAKSNLSPLFVFDGRNITDEAVDKWRTRREIEVEKELKTMLHQSPSILREVLLEHKATVYTPMDIDGDDAVAKFAQMAGENSMILSADRDMFRYGLDSADTRVAAEFSFSDQDLSLQLYASHAPSKPVGVTARSLDDVPFAPEKWLKSPGNPILKSLTQSENGAFQYLRGCCSPVTKRFGSLHGLSRDLRLACYSRLNITHHIHESWPEWDSELKECSWVDEHVAPSRDLSNLLDSPKTALQWLQERDPSFLHGDEHSHRVFARKMIVAELIDAVHNTGMLPIIKQLGLAADTLDVPFGAWPPQQWLESKVIRNCSSCGKKCLFSHSDRAFYMLKGFIEPRRCHSCRELRKQQRHSRIAY